jgi:drug/metabolite transporter (DMT)-like permease
VGVVFILISGAAFGLLPWFARIAYNHGAEPLGMLAVRFLIASFVLVVVSLFRRTNKARPHGVLAWQLFALGAIGYAPQASFYFFSVQRIDISLATIIFYTYPVFVVLASWVFLRHRPSVRVISCLAVAVIGAALTAGQVQAGSISGVLFMFGASLWYTGYIVLSSRVVHIAGAFTSLTYVMVGAAVAHGAVYLVVHPNVPTDGTGWLAIAAASIIGTVLSMGFFFAGVSRVGPGEAAVLSTIEPVVSIAVGVLALNEQVTGFRLLGAALVLVSVAVLAQFSRADTK